MLDQAVSQQERDLAKTRDSVTRNQALSRVLKLGFDEPGVAVYLDVDL